MHLINVVWLWSHIVNTLVASNTDFQRKKGIFCPLFVSDPFFFPSVFYRVTIGPQKGGHWTRLGGYQ